MAVTNKPQIEAFIGASGSGKGVSINERLRELQPKRLVIWDPRNEYGKQARPVSDLRQFAAAMKAAGKGGPLRIRFVPTGKHDKAKTFGLICEAVFLAGNLVFVAEELSQVTRPSYAPPAWQQISSQGRHQGLHVLGAAQRPTMIDKDFLGNCTKVRVFMLGYDSDMVAMAKEVRAPLAELQALFTDEDGDGPGKVTTINGIEYTRRTRELERITIRVTDRGAALKRSPFVASAPTTRARRVKAT